MKKTFTCIVCPNGCSIDAEYTSDKSGKTQIQSMTGNLCPRGKEYVTQELVCPMRTISTSILVHGGELPLASVRLTKPIPREKIFDAMKEIRQLSVDAPVEAGTIILHNILGTDSDVMVTRNVAEKTDGEMD